MTAMLVPRPFSDQARATCLPPAALAVSVAGAFNEVDAPRLHDALERLADEATWSPSQPLEQLQELGAIARSAAFPEFDEPGTPRSLLLDSALHDHRGHADLLAVVLAETGRRLGWRVGIAGNAERLLVAHTALHRPLLLDPRDGELTTPATLQRPVSWRCSHEVTGHLLDRLQRTCERHGRIGDAIRAAAMRCELPLDAESGRRARRRLQSVRARLN